MQRLLRASVKSRLAVMARGPAEYKRNGEGVNVVNTEPQPEGLYYRYIYSYDNIPEHFGRFAEKKYQNAYISRPLFESDNWEFQYHGQWWNTGGSNTLNFLYLIFPLILYGIIIAKEVIDTLHRKVESAMTPTSRTKPNMELSACTNSSSTLATKFWT